MKTTLLIIFIILSGSTKLFSQTEINAKDTLTFYVNNFSSDTGQAVVMLFREEDNLPSTPFMKENGVIKNGKTVISFSDIPFGAYAAIVFHDENMNGVVDHNWLGFSKEPLGFSNEWKLTIISGLPSFSKLKFEFSKQKRDCYISIK